jgi:hypothetical protein
MISSDRRARMLSCAMEGGDLAVAELVQNLGAEGAWAKIVEGVLGEPAAERAGRITIDVVARLAKTMAYPSHVLVPPSPIVEGDQ